MKVVIKKDATGWWIFGFECGPLGPYVTRAEAVSDRDGLTRFYKKESHA